MIGLARREGLASYQYLTKDIHVWPDFHGNRSPISDQNLKGMVNTNHFNEKKFLVVFPLTLDLWTYNVSTRRQFGCCIFGIRAGSSGDISNFHKIYCKTILSQYGTRHILDSLKHQGRPDFETLLICGGLSKNQIFIETHAEACSLPVLCPNEKEMVLVGAAILGACAAKFYPDLEVQL